MAKVKKKVMKARKKNRRKNKRVRALLIVVIVLIYILAMSIPALRSSTAKTMAVENAQIVDSTNSRGIIFKDETVYESETQGSISFSAKEGEKVSRNSKIAEIKDATSTGGSTNGSYEDDLKEVNQEIEEYNKKISSQDETPTQDGVADDKTAIKEQLSKAIEKKKEIVKDMKKSKNVYYAEESGIVSKVIDGYEEKFSSKNIKKYNAKNFKILEAKKTASNEKEEPQTSNAIFKIIENQNWYIMTKIEGENLKELEKGDTVSIKINDGEIAKIDAQIVEIERSKDDVFLVLEMDKHLHDFYKDRYVDIRIIRDVYSGLKVPQKSILKKDGTEGVFIKDISGVVKFRPVKIVKKTQYTTLVEPVEGQDPLNLFDEVFTDGNKVKEDN